MKKFWIALALVAPWMEEHAQYDGTPMQKTQEEAKKAEQAERTGKYPHSDNDWENFDVLHINRHSGTSVTAHRGWCRSTAHGNSIIRRVPTNVPWISGGKDMISPDGMR